MKKVNALGFALLALSFLIVILLLGHREEGLSPRGDSDENSPKRVKPVSLSSEPQGKTRAPLENFDVRLSRVGVARTVGTRLAEIQKVLPGVSVDFDPVTKSPKWIGSNTRLLTGSQEEMAGKDADAPIRQFITAHRALFGHGPEVLDSARRVTDYSTARSPSRKVVWHQQLDGIEIFEAILQANLTPHSTLINIGSQMMPEPEKSLDAATRKALTAKPPVGVDQAVAAAGTNVGEKIPADGVRPMAPAAAQPDWRQQFRAAMLTDAEAKLI